MPDLYNVRLTFDAAEGGQRVADVLVDVFGETESATVARPAAVRREDDHVTVEFHELSPERPPTGEEYRPPRVDEPSEAPGRAAIQELEAMPSDVLLPALRALVALSAARTRAGLPPRQHIVIEVSPAEQHAQDELRHS